MSADFFSGLLVELVAGILIVINVFTRSAAVVLCIYTAVMIFYLDDFWNIAAGPDRMNTIVRALNNFSIVGAFLLLAVWPRRQVIGEPGGTHEWDKSRDQ